MVWTRGRRRRHGRRRANQCSALHCRSSDARHRLYRVSPVASPVDSASVCGGMRPEGEAPRPPGADRLTCDGHLAIL